MDEQQRPTEVLWDVLETARRRAVVDRVPLARDLGRRAWLLSDGGLRAVIESWYAIRWTLVRAAVRSAFHRCWSSSDAESFEWFVDWVILQGRDLQVRIDRAPAETLDALGREHQDPPGVPVSPMWSFVDASIRRGLEQEQIAPQLSDDDDVCIHGLGARISGDIDRLRRMVEDVAPARRASALLAYGAHRRELALELALRWLCEDDEPLGVRLTGLQFAHRKQRNDSAIEDALESVLTRDDVPEPLTRDARNTYVERLRRGLSHNEPSPVVAKIVELASALREPREAVQGWVRHSERPLARLLRRAPSDDEPS